MTGEEMYNDYRDAALTSGIHLPHWAELNVVQQGIWSRMAEGYRNPDKSDG